MSAEITSRERKSSHPDFAGALCIEGYTAAGHPRITDAPSGNARLRNSALLRSGVWTLLAYCAFWALMQSKTLWARPMTLPGGEGGIFGRIRNLFPQEWLQARVGSPIGFANSFIYAALVVFLFLVYARALGLATRPDAFVAIGGRRALWIVPGVAAPVLLILLFVPGTMSADLHSYIWYGRIFHEYGANPFIHTPIEFASQDAGHWLDLVYWKDVPSVYGPVWVWFAGGIAWIASLAGGDISLHLLGHKLLAGTAHMLNIYLVWRVAGLLIPRYGRPQMLRYGSADAQNFTAKVSATLFYAWNPLLLIEFGANGHNDVLLLTFVLAGLWLYLAGRWRMAAFAFAVACLVKVVALLLWPGLLWLLFQQNQIMSPFPGTADELHDAAPSGTTADREAMPSRRSTGALWRVLEAVGIGMVTWIAGYLPFWEGMQTLQPLTGGPAATSFTNSLAYLIRLKGGAWLHGVAVAQGWPALVGSNDDSARFAIEGWIRWIAWGSAFVLAVPSVRLGRTVPRMLEGWGWLLFFYLTVGAVWFWPWYVTWLVVPVALAGPGRLMTATLILCLTSLLLYVVYPELPASIVEILYWRPLLIIAPALTYATASYLLQQKRRVRTA